MMKLTSYLMVTIFFVVDGKPTVDVKKFAGPSLDALHGILMHGDDHMGEDHSVEDIYLRMKDQLDTGKKEIGPKDAEETFHGVLMHADKDVGGHHDHVNKEDFVPHKPAEIKPKTADEEFHGVLMHADDDVGRNHERDHHKMQTTDTRAPDQPKTADEEFHGVLMHADTDTGVDHSDEDAELKVEDNTAPDSPKDAEEQFHGVMMHGDTESGHSHTQEDTRATDKEEQHGDIGPEDVETLMHGGKVHAHDQDDGEKPAENERHAPDGPNPDDLHGILMHGDSEQGHDHSLEDAMARQEPAAKFDLEELKRLGIDEELLKNLNIDELLNADKNNFAEYEKYQEGWTPASITDGILDSIKLLKDRYIYSSEETKDAEDNSEKDKRLLFDAGDDSYDNNQEILDDPGEMHAHEDTRHYLELAGNTDPINRRHKHFKGHRDRDIL